MNKEIDSCISKMIELDTSQASVQDGGYITTKFIVCDFNPNKNNYQIDRNISNVEEMIKTLDGKPLVGKVLVDNKGDLTFGTHEMYITEEVDENGNTIKKYHFDTEAIGYFYDTKIEEIDGIEYVTSYARIWTRFEEATQIIIDKFNDNEEVKISWEIATIKYNYKLINSKNIKVAEEFYFEGVCLLGVSQAYKCAKLVDISSLENEEIQLAQALTRDVIKLKTKDKSENIENIISKTVKETLEQYNNLKNTSIDISNEENIKNQGGNETMPKAKVTKIIETSSLTLWDLHQKVYDALNPKGWNSNPYYSGIMIFPEEHRVVCYDIDRDTETDYLEATYSVDESDKVVLSALKEVELEFKAKSTTDVSEQKIVVNLDETAKLLSQKDTTISELQGKILNLETDISTKVDAITKAGEQLATKDEIIAQKDTEISELKPFKDQIETIQKEKTEKEVAEKRVNLKKLATKGGYIKDEEIETSEEIKKAIDEVDENKIKSIIADRVIAQLEKNNGQPEVEVSSLNNKPKVNLSSGSDDEEIDYKSVMNKFLNK